MNKFTVEVTDKTFDSEVTQSIRPVLVYFWADWSEECRYMSPIVDAATESKRTFLQVATLDVDANPRMAQKLAIAMVPTLILFIRGQEQKRFEGITTAKHLSATIDMHIEDDSGDAITDETNSVN